MTQALLTPAVGNHTDQSQKCPFCPGKEERKWKTYPGGRNSAKKLRAIMKDPSKLNDEQPQARPVAGPGTKQDKNDFKPTYDKKLTDTIFDHDKDKHGGKKSYGPYSNQAHHAISGKQIMHDHPIEHLIHKKHGKIKEHTGYCVNNYPNGVCLPSYPKSYYHSKKNKTTPWADEDKKLKQEIAKYAMKELEMQAHIGQHDVPPSKEKVAPIHKGATYPGVAKKLLQQLHNAAMSWAAKCPVCEKPNGDMKKPLPPPYRINKYLDGISAELIAHITSPPGQWVYFISTYADQYHNFECCSHPKSRAGGK